MSENRIAEVKTAASAEFLLLTFIGSERLGRLFEFELEVATKDVVDDLDDILGKPTSVSIKLHDGGERHFAGLATEISYRGKLPNGHFVFSISVRPWLWMLTQCSDNRVFQDKSVPDILQEVFQDHGFSDLKKQLQKTYDNRDYCVQYGESDFDFVSRLMEEEGIYYTFEHSKSKHDLVLFDDSSKHGALPGGPIPFREPGASKADYEHVFEWTLRHKIRSQIVHLQSYDYLNPKGDLKAEEKTSVSVKHGQKDLARYEYGKLYTVKGDGKSFAQARVAEHMTDYEFACGISNSQRIEYGKTFKLEDHPDKSQDGTYLVVSAKYQLTTSNVEQFDEKLEPDFECSFSVVKKDVQFRSQRRTPKAAMRGPQTAVVVGKKGEEIYTDEHGRIKVQFHWDRVGDKNENSSCWVRVSQGWAGNAWGMIALPRMGQEVIVDFLEGDPDQPIVTGCVYNADNKPPFKLPDNKTQSGIRTRSSLKGDTKTFNELRFEDKKGEEEIYVHAEKNFKRVVENNDVLEVGLESGSTKDGEASQTITIQHDRTILIKDGDDAFTIENGDRLEYLQKGNKTVKLDDGNRTVELANGDDELTLKNGDQKIDISNKIAIKAGDELTITVGQAKLTMKKDGTIKLEGMKIEVAANGSMKLESKGTMDVKGAKSAVEGTGMLDLKSSGIANLKGSMTMIG